MSPSSPSSEPKPLTGELAFEESDFRALSETYSKNPDYNDRRLAGRRRLLTLGKRVAKAAKEAGTPLDCRTSLHHPHAFNGMRVRRLWAYLTRPKAERTRLKRILGSELGKDLDSSYRNAYLCLALEAEHLEVSLKLHHEAWYDGQNLKNRLKAEGLEEWRGLLNGLAGFRLRLADWKGEWRCGELTLDSLEELLGYWQPGDHTLSIESRFPAPEGARGPALEPAAPAHLEALALSLLPLYRYTVWSEESSYLFGS